jgi:hypothetical protein
MFPQTIKIRASRHCNLRQSSLEKSSMSENPLFTRFSVFYFSTLDINTTHSTCNERGGLMSWADFLHLTFTGTYQRVFSIFPENERSRKQIDRRNRRSSIYFTWCKINSYSINDFIISISCLSVCLYLSRLLSLSTILPSSTTSASASTTIDMPFSTYNSFLT